MVLFGVRSIGIYEGMLLYNISLVVGMFLFIFKVMLTKHSLFEYIIIGGLLLLSLIIYKNSGEKGLLLYFTMMLGMKGVSKERVFKTGLLVLSISFVTVVTLSLIGLKEEIFYMQKRGDVEMFRHALGYPHPNTLHTTYVILIALIVYILGKQNWKKLLTIYSLLFIGSLYIYLYSGSRTGLIISGFYLCVNFYFHVRGKLSSFEKLCVFMVYPACTIFSLLGPLVIKGKLYDIINKILNNRLMLSVYYLENEPITLLGTRFKEAPNSQYMIDSSFLYSFLQLGVVAFFILILLYMVTIHICIKKEEKAELALIVSFCIMGITDPFLFNLSYKNLGFIIIGTCLYQVVEGLIEENTFLRKSIQILKIGNKEVQIPCIKDRGYNISKGRVFKMIMIYGIVGILSSGIYSLVAVEPKQIYIDEATWKHTARVKNLDDKSEWVKYASYLTEEEVRILKEEGNIVENYQSVGEPMYMFEGSVVKMEYIRNIVSVGVWTGMFVTIIYVAIILSKKKF